MMMMMMMAAPFCHRLNLADNANELMVVVVSGRRRRGEWEAIERSHRWKKDGGFG